MSFITPEAVREKIQSRLLEIEEAHQVRIVYACESGSRAWGFPSADSDYDVRFIYLKPLEWYLSLEIKRDVIEYPISEQLDINGWDLKKALTLLRRTNPPLLEWIGSPIVYLSKYGVIDKLRIYAKEYYSPSVCLYHYLHMARGNYREYLQGEIVWVKKYFYVLRPILAMQWIECGLGIVPTDFTITMANLPLDPVLKNAIATLLERKRSGDELEKGERIPVISDFIQKELGRWDNSDIPKRAVIPHHDALDAFFRQCLQEVWSKPPF